MIPYYWKTLHFIKIWCPFFYSTTKCIISFNLIIFRVYYSKCQNYFDNIIILFHHLFTHMLTKVQLQTIDHLLWSFNFNAKEREVYFLAWEIWPSSIAQLALKSWIKRVTIHAMISKLIQEWLFIETWRWKKRLISPAPYESLEAIIEQKQSEIQKLASELQATRPLFDHLRSLTQNFPKVRMLQWREWLNTTLVEMANDNQDVYIINDAHSLNERIDLKTLHRSYQTRAKKWTKTSMIFPTWFKDFWNIEWDDDYLIHIKTLSPSSLIDGWIEIWWNKVALHCYKEGYVTTTILENPEIAAIMKQLFRSQRQLAQDYLWSFIMV